MDIIVKVTVKPDDILYINWVGNGFLNTSLR